MTTHTSPSSMISSNQQDPVKESAKPKRKYSKNGCRECKRRKMKVCSNHYCFNVVFLFFFFGIFTCLHNLICIIEQEDD